MILYHFQDQAYWLHPARMQQTLATTVNAWSLEDQLRFRAWAADNAPIREGWMGWRALDPRPGLGGQESRAFGDPIRVPLPQEGGWDTVSTRTQTCNTLVHERARSRVFSHLSRLLTLSLHFPYFQVLLVMGDMQRRLGQVAQSNATALETTAAALRSEGKLPEVVGGQLMRGRVAPFSLDPPTQPSEPAPRARSPKRKEGAPKPRTRSPKCKEGAPAPPVVPVDSDSDEDCDPPLRRTHRVVPVSGAGRTSSALVSWN